MAKAHAKTEDMLHVMKWHNGDKAWSPFSDKEMSPAAERAAREARRAQDRRRAVHLLSQYLLLLGLPLLLLRPQVRPGHRLAALDACVWPQTRPPRLKPPSKG